MSTNTNTDSGTDTETETDEIETDETELRRSDEVTTSNGQTYLVRSAYRDAGGQQRIHLVTTEHHSGNLHDLYLPVTDLRTLLAESWTYTPREKTPRRGL